MHETIGFAVLIYSHISILVHNREDTIQNHTSLLIKVLLKCFKLIFSSDATLPPCTPETCTIAYKLNKCGMIVYQIGGLITGEVSFGIGTVVAVVLVVGIVYLLFRKNKYEDERLTIRSVDAAGRRAALK